jgi:[lysine-biosynthesis-protein LysW]--L-2-aminoadipate ligase
MKIGVLCSRVRVEEKMIFQALRERRVEFDRIDVRRLILAPDDTTLEDYDAILIRCVSSSRALYAARLLQERGVRAVNSYEVIATCGDKILTTFALAEHEIPTPRTAIAFTPQQALAAIEEMGYPVVLKPVVGSWGRLIAKVNDRDAAETVLEHKMYAAGGMQNAVFYVQDYIDKPGRDIRTLVAGDEVVYAVYRRSAHWITNTARGGEPLPCPLTPEIADLSLAAARAMGGGIVAVDLLETADGRLLVNEVNHTPEFHGAMQATEADIAGKIVDYVLSVAEVRRTSKVRRTCQEGK